MKLHAETLPWAGLLEMRGGLTVDVVFLGMDHGQGLGLQTLPEGLVVWGAQ